MIRKRQRLLLYVGIAIVVSVIVVGLIGYNMMMRAGA